MRAHSAPRRTDGRTDGRTSLDIAWIIGLGMSDSDSAGCEKTVHKNDDYDHDYDERSRTDSTGDPSTCSCILRQEWKKGGAFCDFTTILAVRRGHRKCLEYAYENGCPIHEEVYLEQRLWTPERLWCVDFVIECGAPIRMEAVVNACRDLNNLYLDRLLRAWRGGLKLIDKNGEALKTLENISVDLIELVVKAAGFTNFYVDDAWGCIRSLRAAGCEWRAEHTAAVALKGNLKLLKRIVEEGCPWHEDTLKNAEKAGYKALIEYATKHDHELKQRTNIATLFEALELRKETMTNEEYVRVAAAAQELYNCFKPA